MHDSSIQSTKSKIQVGDAAPDFTLPTQSGTPVSLKDFTGKTAIVLYFYPRDNTPGCTAEACAFRDSYEVFKDAGAEVIGISSDSVESHQQFAARHRLPFILLSDVAQLTEREREILDLLARGASNREISETLYIAGGTVKNHLSNILGKLGVRDRTQAALKARELGLL